MTSPTDERPGFVVSLDFELRWGLHDHLGVDISAGRREIEGAREAVPLLLDALERRDLRATWATVGALACRGWDEYFARAPAPPRFHDRRLALDRRVADLDPRGRLHFAPELVELVRRTPGQELGTHTFSHLPLRERGVTAADAAADFDAVSRLWRERFGAPPRSLAFPRNQIAFLDVARAAGIRVWRGNPRAWYYDRNEAATNGHLARLFRLADDLGLGGRHTGPFEGGIVRSSLFLRLGLPPVAWRLHVARIRRALRGLGRGELFHLWWHPHNLGADVRGRIVRVREVLDLAAEKVACGRLRSLAMGDLMP